jgi:hypothetical protein
LHLFSREKTPQQILLDKHGIAITVKPVSHPDGFIIGFKQKLSSGPGGNKQDQTRTWQVKIG